MNKFNNKMTDSKLLSLIAQGDKLAFSQLMDSYLPAVILFAQRYFPQRSDAEDIAQETFTKLWCKAPIWQDNNISVKAWLYRVAYNHCIDQLRKKKIEYQPDSDENIVDESAFIERLMDVEAALAIQKTALEALPERQRTALLLCTTKGLSNREAALVLGVSTDALESLLARGRRKLKQLYQQTVEQQVKIERGIANDVH